MPREGVATCFPFITLDFQNFDPTFVLSLLQTMHCGGGRAVTSGAMENLFQEIRALSPTHIGAPPAFWSQLHRMFRCGTSVVDIKALLGRRLQGKLLTILYA